MKNLLKFRIFRVVHFLKNVNNFDWKFANFCKNRVTRFDIAWWYIYNMDMSATKSGRRLVPLSEGLIPSVYIDIFSKRKYQSEGGDCSYVFRSDFSICDNAYSSRRFVLSNWQTKITAQAPIWCGYNLYYILIQSWTSRLQQR